ncbi:SCAN domain-containing protein 3-like [Lates calcarifer]|uniref:SCAN domain-containing protein 3-like n=1 Tax=Lates calcarifer TaxID=8187 RepID=A0AAJ8DQU0_LATCA|nr:SCAN domain-containing protein 3-like [Lates calcarifer]
MPNDETAEKSKTVKKNKTAFNGKYQESYLKYGLILTGDSRAPGPLYMICGDRLSNEAMKPSKLLQHIETKHPALEDKTELLFFKEKRTGQNGETDGQKQVFRTTTAAGVAAQRAPYFVANVAKAKRRPFTVGEELMLPAAKDICRELAPSDSALCSAEEKSKSTALGLHCTQRTDIC